MAVNTLEEFETLPESLVAEFVDGRIRVFKWQIFDKQNTYSTIFADCTRIFSYISLPKTVSLFGTQKAKHLRRIYGVMKVPDY